MKITTQDKILNTLNTAQIATAYNLEPWFSTLEDFDDRLQTPYRALLTLEKKQLIKEVLVSPQVGTLHKWNTFYTPVGNKVEPIRETMLRHESGIADVVLAFIFLYPDFDVTVDYRKKFELKDFFYYPDALITLSKDGKMYQFLLEFERSHKPDDFKTRKIDKILKLGRLDKLGLSPHTKVLVVVSHENYGGYYRPSQYAEVDKAQMNQVHNRFEAIRSLKCSPIFRFLPFPDFYRLNEPVWFSPTGSRVKLIN